ncbi:MAG: type II toxin-antitoxin system RelE/ParE family toxin [Euryarchaeota archaeon]|nr:type II toxin-antitoxin system RelE/ParE family toxin [Euryarchaeota archaeon]
MGEYTITFTRSAQKELGKLSYELEGRILLKINQLKKDPRPRGCIRLRGDEGLWRLRVGDYRIIYAIDDERKAVDVGHVRHRKNAYD